MGTQSTLFFIIILIAAVWQIITVIVNAVAKKQQQEKMAETARQRQRAGGNPGEGSPDRERGGMAVAGRSRLDEIAARRQAQLEELRMRRESQSRPVQVRTGGATTVPPTMRRAPTAPVPRQPPPRDISPPGAARQSPGDLAGERQAAERASREAMQRRLDQQARLQHQQREAQARQRAEMEAAQAKRRTDAARRVADKADRISPYRLRGPQMALVKQLFSQPGMLRQAIVLKEIIDRPVSLRSPEQSPGHVPGG